MNTVNEIWAVWTTSTIFFNFTEWKQKHRRRLSLKQKSYVFSFDGTGTLQSHAQSGYKKSIQKLEALTH